MKINKYISLDEDIFHKLQREDNASELVNRQMREYYDVKSCKSIEQIKNNLSEIKQILKDNRRKERILNKEIYNIQKKNKEFLTNIQGRYPKELLDQLKKIENLDYEAAVVLSRKFDLHRFNIGGIKLIKVWEELKKNV
jgi:hypothetical protein